MHKNRQRPVKIAVTGHRLIKYDVQLLLSIRQVLQEINKEHRNSEILLYSALAEGCDQLVAEIALEFKNIRLNVPLPMEIGDYLKDFNSDKAQEKFQELMSRAYRVELLPASKTHQEAYHNLGVYLVEHADVILAVWNGEFNQKIGGTSDVVQTALTAGKKVYWIFCPNEAPDANNSVMMYKEIGEVEKLGSFD